MAASRPPGAPSPPAGPSVDALALLAQNYRLGLQRELERARPRLVRLVQPPLPHPGELAAALPSVQAVAVALEAERRAEQQARARGAPAADRGRLRLLGALDLETELGAAIEQRALRLFYQPIIETSSGRLIAFEALARWEHPRLGLLLPGQFLPVASRRGWLRPLERWALETAVRQLAAFRNGHPQACNLRVHLNLSAASMAAPELPAEIDQALRSAGLERGALGIELPELALGSARSSLAALREAGAALFVDHFGAGSAWLHQLGEAICGIKLDVSLLVSSSKDRPLLRGLVGLAAAVGKTVVAVGVETEAQLEVVQGAGCPSVQGRLLAAPVGAPEATALLQRA